MADQSGGQAAVAAGRTDRKGRPSPGSISHDILKKRRKVGSIGSYGFKEKMSRLTSGAAFLDSIILVIAFLALSLGIGFYPWPVVIVLAVALFAATRYQPFIGLLAYTLMTFPIYMYQVPVLAWAFTIGATIILIYGYKHYRVMAFVYLLYSLSFSPAGYLLAIPAFILAALVIGNKRSVITLLLTFVLVISFSAVTGVQNMSYIAYNAQAAHSALSGSGSSLGSVLPLDGGMKPALQLSNFTSDFGAALAPFFGAATSQISNGFAAIVESLTLNFSYLLQLAVLIATAIAIDWYASKSRSKLKGLISSAFGVTYPITYVALIIAADGATVPAPFMLALPFLSFLIAPAVLYILESAGVSIVKVMEVRKQDIRMRFGTAFEDLSNGNASEVFDDIGNYDSVKKELKAAVIAPIENRAISRAYNVKPTKGILFFGPPGTGKTMMMRALSNEVHAGFFYVKASDLISAYPGESERKIADTFSTARKNAPCVLFFDEIDSITLGRNTEGVDDAHRHALSQLLVEMDGFQKVNNIIIVGATNRPDLVDAAILRPGRFDKLIYMPLPDLEGRKRIFEIYLSKLPVGDDIDIGEIARASERYSGADIKAVCETVGQSMIQEATSEHHVLMIPQEDIIKAIKSTKPSTTLSQLDEYKRFKLDFERNLMPEAQEEQKKVVGIDDVIGLDSAKKALREALVVPLTRPELMKKYDIKAVNGILLFGPPGNGKTMLMKAVNNEMHGVTMLELSGSEIAEAGVERALATVKETFNRARENQPSVIFIDEIDGLIPKREGATEFSTQLTSEVLKEVDGLKESTNILVIGATNRPYMLDPAILRPGRFDKLIYVKPPQPKARSDMFKKYLSGVPVADDVDYAKLGADTRGFTGADIANVCREAKTGAMELELYSGQEDGKITMSLIEKTMASVKPSAPDDVLKEYDEFLAKYGQR